MWRECGGSAEGVRRDCGASAERHSEQRALTHAGCSLFRVLVNNDHSCCLSPALQRRGGAGGAGAAVRPVGGGALRTRGTITGAREGV
jgi:hypothetical protein